MLLLARLCHTHPGAWLAVTSLFLVLLAACTNRPISLEPTAEVTTEVTQLSNSTGANVLIIADGIVRFQRPPWNNFSTASLGTPLRHGDLLSIEGGEQIAVLCSNLSLWLVPNSGVHGVNNGCLPPPEPDVETHEGKVGQARFVSTEVPYILSPRRTVILSKTPLLRWHAVPGVSEYTVRMRGGGLDWSEQVQGTEVLYPGTPRLVPGQDYLLVVEADGKSSEQEGIVDLGFYLATDQERAALERDLKKIEDMNLPPTATALARAYLYANRPTGEGWHFYYEAINQLQELIDRDVKSAAVHQLLGNFYTTLGLSNEAAEQYHLAAEQARVDSDVAALALAQYSLGQLYHRPRPEEAISWYEKALESYREFGDKEGVEAATAALNELP